MVITILILILSAVFFAMGRVRSDLVALCALTMLVVFQILTPEEALSGFSNNVVIMMVGLFVVGGAIFQTGLAKMIGSKMMQLAGKSELKLLILVMLVTAGIGAFVSNTGTVALMLPIVVSMAAGAGVNPSRLLMPLAFASSMGGMMTLIGTPPNLVINDTLMQAGYASLSFFSFTPVGIVCIVVGIVMLIPLTRIFLSKKGDEAGEKKTGSKSLKELVNEYQLADNLFRVKVTEASSVVGKTVMELNVYGRYGLTILEVRRISKDRRKPFLKSVSQKPGAPDTVLLSGDIIYMVGEFSHMEHFAGDHGLEVMDVDTSAPNAESAPQGKAPNKSLEFYEIGIAELVLMPTSSMENRTVKDSAFREKYGVNVLGIQRRKEYFLLDLKDLKMHAGDVLLVQGTWENIARLSQEQSEWVVLGQPLQEAAKVTLDYKAPVAAAIMLLMVVSMVFDFIPVAPVTAVLIAALLMVLTGCIRSVEAAYKTINWESIVLIAGMLPMSLALEKTGASAWVSQSLVNGLGSYGPLVMLAGIYFTTSLLTMFISNTATAVLLAPIALVSAQQLGVSPYPFLFAVAVAASMCFASPFSTPPNALVMPAGRYTFMDYVKVGVPLQLVMGIVMVLVLPLLFPF